MKLFFLAACFLLVINGFSQSFRMSATALSMSSDDVSGIYNNGDSYSGKVEGGLQWGAGAEYLINNHYGLELGFLHQKTKIPLSFTSGNMAATKENDINIGLLSLKGNRYFGKKTNKVQGVIGIGAGFNFINYNDDESSKAYPCFQINTGVIYWPGSAIGIKINGQYQYSSKGTGEAIYISYWSDYYSKKGLKSSTPLSQYGFGLSMILVMDEIFKDF